MNIVLPRPVLTLFLLSKSQLNNKLLAAGGPIDEDADNDDTFGQVGTFLPGAKRADDGSRHSKVEVLTKQVAFSSTGREWAVVSGEGLHVYSLDDDMIFDPIFLTETITPAAVEAKLAIGDYGLALRMAAHLNEYDLVKEVIEHTPFESIVLVVRSINLEQLERIMQFIAKSASTSPHIEFYLEWCLQILQTHGMYMDKHRGTFMRAFRSLNKVIQTHYDDVKTITNENRYSLEFLQDHASLTTIEEKNAIVASEQKA
jgi:periodic tryptophan protein 2